MVLGLFCAGCPPCLGDWELCAQLCLWERTSVSRDESFGVFFKKEAQILSAQLHQFLGCLESWYPHTAGWGGSVLLPLPAPIRCFALVTAWLHLCSGGAKIKTVTPLQTENRAFLLCLRALDGHQKPSSCCKIPCVKAIFYSDPLFAVVGMFSSQTCAQGAPRWALPGNGKHKHKKPTSLQLIALNKSSFCSREGLKTEVDSWIRKEGRNK